MRRSEPPDLVLVGSGGGPDAFAAAFALLALGAGLVPVDGLRRDLDLREAGGASLEADGPPASLYNASSSGGCWNFGIVCLHWSIAPIARSATPW